MQCVTLWLGAKFLSFLPMKPYEKPITSFTGKGVTIYNRQVEKRFFCTSRKECGKCVLSGKPLFSDEGVDIFMKHLRQHLRTQETWVQVLVPLRTSPGPLDGHFILWASISSSKK